MIDQTMNRISILSLVACDASYYRADDYQVDVTKLGSHPDNSHEDEYSFPLYLAERTGEAFTPGEYVVPAGTGAINTVSFPDWTLVRRVDNQETGFAYAVFHRQSSNEYIVALTGTNGPDAQDWYANISLATTQWNEAAKRDLTDFLMGLPPANAQPATIHFTGQSLGGALAQYAAYEYAHSRGELFDPNTVTLTTFNGLGSVDGLIELYGQGFQPHLLADVRTAHYVISNDVVHRLGGSNLNAAGNTYRFDFRNPFKDAPLNYLDPVAAHRIESGFYYGFESMRLHAPYQEWDFLQASNADVELIDGTSARKIAFGFGNIFNNSDHGYGESVLRLAAAMIVGLRDTPQEELEKLWLPMVDAAERSGFLFGNSPATYKALRRYFLPAAKVWSRSTTATAVAGNTLLFAIIWDSLRDPAVRSNFSFDQAKGFVNDLLERMLPDGTPPLLRADLAETFFAGKSRTDVLFAVEAGLAFLGNSFPAGGMFIDLAAIDRSVLVSKILTSTSWITDVLGYVAQQASASQENVADALTNVSAALLQLAKGAGAELADGGAFLSAVANEIGVTLTGVLKSMSNAYGELLAKYADPLFAWGSAVTFAALRDIERALQASLEDARFVTIHPLIEQALQITDLAWQAVAVRAGRPGNPFDDEGFDPAASPVVAADLNEGSIQSFTVYLPYAAREAGQHVKLTLDGTSTDFLSLLAGDAEIELGVDGTFTLMIAEGQREVTFSIVADGDVEVDEALELSAQLLDENAIATHSEHQQATIALFGETEAPPMGGREVRGDWAPKPYVDPESGEIGYHMDDLGNIERDPGVPNTIGFQDPDGKLDGSSGADHIVTGDYMDTVWAYEGDDYITGSDVWGTVVYAGAGNDWVEALLYTDHVAEYLEFERHGHTIKLGEDLIYGGPGDDRLYGESEASVDTLYDPSVMPTGRPGDWTSAGTGNDWVYGGAGDDVLMGGLGEDHLVGGAGMDVMLGDDDFGNATAALYWTVLHPNFGESMPGFGDFEFGLFPVFNYYPNINVGPGDTNTLVQDPYVSYYKLGGGADVLLGGAGKDILIGQLGDDTLYGGLDDDLLAGWEGADRIYGGEGNDRIAGEFGRYEQPSQRVVPALEVAVPGLIGAPLFDGSVVDQVGNDLLDGGAGNDVVFGEGGDDVVLGGDGADTLYGDADYLPNELHGNDLLDGGAGDDGLFGNGGDDRLYGGEGSDVLRGGSGNDLLDGGIGDDVLEGEDGDDTLRGGAGSDFLSGGSGADQLRGGTGDDRLVGGDDDDILWGEAGVDTLDGSRGNDALYGGAGEDIISGGEGDDFLDGGAGIDILRGGAGDDTYFVAPGYGADIIEDSKGQNRIRFGVGVLPEDVRADLEASTLLAALSFGLPGDSVAMNLRQFDIGTVQFADGTTWARRELLNVVPALVSEGGEGSDFLLGHAGLRNELRGMAGDDWIGGSSNDDLIEGGDGADLVDGAEGADRFVYRAGESGIDELADSGLAAIAYLEWFYGRRGITDWMERASYGGRYRVEMQGEGGSFAVYFDTYEAAYDAQSSGKITYIEPLEEIAPLITRNDTEALAELVGAGVVDLDVVEFAPGITMDDLSISVTVEAVTASQHPEQPWHGGGTLSVRWAGAGFDLAVPDATYGFAGIDLLRDGDDEDSADGAWRGYRLGEGVEAFRFADGSQFSLEEILERASVFERIAPYEFYRDSGEQLISREHEAIAFRDAILYDEVRISREGVDLIVSVDGSRARIAGWYSDPSSLPAMSLRFEFDPEVDAQALTEAGLAVSGSQGDDHIVGLDAFADRIQGGPGNDVLDGGGGKDIYVFDYGDGFDTVPEVPVGVGDPEASVIVFGPGIYSWRLEPAGGSLLIHYGESDAIRFSAFDSADPYATPVFDRLELADGSVYSFEELLEQGFVLSGTEEDDVLQGTALSDSLYGTGGDDVLIGSAGADFLYGGEGSDLYVYEPGDGRDEIYDADDSPNYVDTLRFDGAIAPEDVRVATDFSSLYLLVGAGSDRIVLVGALDDPAGRVERVEFANGTVWTPEDLFARIDTRTSTEFDDLLYGSDDADVFDGLAGADDITGLGGADVLYGGSGDDYIDAGEGHDIVRGDDGNDWLVGGGGQDLLEGNAGGDYLHVQGGSLVIGGAGSDWIDNFGPGTVVAFNPGDGDDTVYAADSFTLSLGGGIAPADLALSADGDDLVLAVGDSDSIRLTRQWESDPQAWPQITLQLFGSVHLYDFNAAIDALAGRPGLEGFALEEVLAAHRIGFSESSAYGGAIAHRYAATGATSGLATEELQLALQHEDFGAALQPITVEVANRAPVLANAIGDQEADEDASSEFTVAEDAFADPDAGDTLTYAAGPLPGWLSFDAIARSFSGTPANEDVGSFWVEVTAKDSAGASATATFTITVVNENDAPTLERALPDLEASEDQPFFYAVPDDTFADVDAGDTLTLAAEGLPTWLAFHPDTQTFTGTPRNADVGSFDILVSATDGGGLHVSDAFHVEVINVNDAPVVANALGVRSFEAGSPFSFVVPSDTFADEDSGDSRSLSAALFGGGALPAWLAFDPARTTFSGNPGRKVNGIWQVVLTATDAAGISASADLGVVIQAPAGSTAIGGKGDDLIYGGTGDEVLFAKGGSDAIFGGAGNDLIMGGSGSDVLQGGEGSDVLSGGTGQNVLDGGAGDDMIHGGRGSSLIAGGSGNDIVRTGSGSDVIVFNRGDGTDTVISDRTADNTLSLGGGIRYADLSLSRQGKSLVVNTGSDDRIILKNWYAGKHSVLNLQIILDASDEFDAGSSDPLYNRKVQSFDFRGLVSAFDETRRASPGLTSWALTNALLQFHLAGADDAALGGDLAYWYAKNRSFDGISLAAAQQVIGAASFGSEAQSLRPFFGLQEGFVKLS